MMVPDIDLARRRGIRPDPPILVSDWADPRRRLSAPVQAARGGPAARGHLARAGAAAAARTRPVRECRADEGHRRCVQRRGRPRSGAAPPRPHRPDRRGAAARSCGRSPHPRPASRQPAFGKGDRQPGAARHRPQHRRSRRRGARGPQPGAGGRPRADRCRCRKGLGAGAGGAGHHPPRCGSRGRPCHRRHPARANFPDTAAREVPRSGWLRPERQ